MSFNGTRIDVDLDVDLKTIYTVCVVRPLALRQFSGRRTPLDGCIGGVFSAEQ